MPSVGASFLKFFDGFWTVENCERLTTDEKWPLYCQTVLGAWVEYRISNGCLLFAFHFDVATKNKTTHLRRRQWKYSLHISVICEILRINLNQTVTTIVDGSKAQIQLQE